MNLSLTDKVTFPYSNEYPEVKLLTSTIKTLNCSFVIIKYVLIEILIS